MLACENCYESQKTFPQPQAWNLEGSLLLESELWISHFLTIIFLKRNDLRAWEF